MVAYAKQRESKISISKIQKFSYLFIMIKYIKKELSTKK